MLDSKNPHLSVTDSSNALLDNVSLSLKEEMEDLQKWRTESATKELDSKEIQITGNLQQWKAAPKEQKNTPLKKAARWRF